jgi:hypothetical protein
VLYAGIGVVFSESFPAGFLADESPGVTDAPNGVLNRAEVVRAAESRAVRVFLLGVGFAPIPILLPPPENNDGQWLVASKPAIEFGGQAGAASFRPSITVASFNPIQHVCVLYL